MTPRARLQGALNVDTAIGVLRHADAGYEDAIESAREHGLGLEHDRCESSTCNAVHAAVAGGSVLAAGGGGWVDHGMLVGTTAVQYGITAAGDARRGRSRRDARDRLGDRRARGGRAGRCAPETTCARWSC